MHSLYATFDLIFKFAAKWQRPLRFSLLLLLATVVTQQSLASEVQRSTKPSFWDRCYKSLIADIEDYPHLSDNPADIIRHESRRPDGSLDLHRYVRELVRIYRNTGGLIYWEHFKKRRRLNSPQRFQLREARMRLSYMGDNLRELARSVALRLTNEELEQVKAALEDYSYFEVR